MVITHNFTMALNRRGVTPVVDAVQGDSLTRKLAVTLIEDKGAAWSVPGGVTAAVAFRKPDGHMGLYAKLPDGSNAVAVSSNTVTAVLAPEVLSCAGEVWAAIVLHDKNLAQLATFPVCIRVAANPAAGTAVSNDYYSYSTMEDVSEAVEAALAQLETDKQAFLKEAEEALLAVYDAATEDAPAIVCEESGSVIAVNDASNRLLQGLTLYGKTTQDGTPTPENPVEMVSAGASGSIRVAVTGKNLLVYTEDNRHVSNGTVVAGSSNVSAIVYTKGIDRIYVTGNYSLLNTNVIRAGLFTEYPAIGVVGTHKLLYSTDNLIDVKDYNYILLSFSYYSTGATGEDIKKSFICTLEDNATYEYPTAQILTASTPNGLPGIPVTSGGNYTDESGQQWVCDTIDFAQGIYTKRVETKILTGTENWKKCNPETWYDATDYLETGNGSIAGYNRNENYCLCNQYISTSRASIQGVTKAGCCALGANGNEINFTTDLPAVEEWKAELAQKYAAGNPVIIQYVRKTPVETPLSAEELAQFASLHTNKPNTTAFNDSGAHMALEYNADTKIYIDNKFAELAAAIVNNA